MHSCYLDYLSMTGLSVSVSPYSLLCFWSLSYESVGGLWILRANPLRKMCRKFLSVIHGFSCPFLWYLFSFFFFFDIFFLQGFQGSLTLQDFSYVWYIICLFEYITSNLILYTSFISSNFLEVFVFIIVTLAIILFFSCLGKQISLILC